MLFKEIFAQHLPDLPEGVETSLDEFVVTCPKIPSAGQGELQSELQRIISHLDYLQTEDALRLHQETQLKMCSEIAISALSMLTTKDTDALLREVMHKLLIAKNHDYGNAYGKFGSWGIIIRMWDKVLRVINLLDLDEDHPWVSESITDTLRDLAGYAALLYVCLRSETIQFVERHP